MQHRYTVEHWIILSTGRRVWVVVEYWGNGLHCALPTHYEQRRTCCAALYHRLRAVSQ